MKNIVKEIKIGSLSLESNLFLSPMAQITNAAFRLLCARGGAAMTATEMISAESLVRLNKKSLEMTRIFPGEKKVSFQIFGSNPENMARAAGICEKSGASVVDINAGCPVKKILRSGSGAMLMKRPSLLADIIKKIRQSVSIPVTVKIRSGFLAEEISSSEIAGICEGEGADAVTLHARSVSQGHSGAADLKAVEKTAKKLRIPLIGNGGISSASGVAAMINAGCSGVSIGRAAAANPFIFGEIKREFSGQAGGEISPREKIELFIRFLDLNVRLYGEKWGVIRARKLTGYFLMGMPEAAFLRAQFMKAENLGGAKKILRDYLEKTK